MDLSNEIKVRYGTDIVLTFERPSNSELNAYGRAKFPSAGRRVKNNMVGAQIEYFDRWIRKIENAFLKQDGTRTPLTLDNLALFPGSIKCEVMFAAFDRSEVDVLDDEGEPVGEDLAGNS